MAKRELPQTITTAPKGRGCPNCGSHSTVGLVGHGAQWCHSCDHKWLPCRAHCRGYDVSTDGDSPKILGCKNCGTPDHIAKWWPEAYVALSKQIIQQHGKSDPVPSYNPRPRRG